MVDFFLKIVIFSRFYFTEQNITVSQNLNVCISCVYLHIAVIIPPHVHDMLRFSMNVRPVMSNVTRLFYFSKSLYGAHRGKIW